MLFKQKLGLVLALAMVGSMPAISEAALAKKLGAKYGGKLSSNKATKTQQLAADPVSVLYGSTSTTYDPSVVSLKSIDAAPGFFITNAYVEVDFGEGNGLVSYTDFFYGESSYQETGYLQVFYSSATESSLLMAAALQEDDGYVVVDTDGEQNGDVTHNMLFDYIAENENTIAHYRLYADSGDRGSDQDSLTSYEDPNFRITDIGEANVAGALIPLPAAFLPGLIGLGGAGIAAKFRKRLVA